mgnify:CR=1 FL=1
MKIEILIADNIDNIYDEINALIRENTTLQLFHKKYRTGGEVWVIRILAIVAVLFIMGIIMVIIMETIKQYKKMWNEISQMFLIGSLSGIAVLGDVTRKYLPVNLILLFILINMGIMLLRIYLRKKFDYM